VEPKITPEPSADEHAAILAALDLLAADAQPPAYGSAWRREGIRENSADASNGDDE
jgi:hypothetical protein